MLLAILSIMFGALLGTGLTMLGVMFALRFIEVRHPMASSLAPLSEEPHVMS